jgi:biofilm PGA synthesis N-glycosyltransferase PgaC
MRNITPSVSFIVAAYNEEKIIREKIENDLKLDYPKNKIEIIIVSDGSSDSTPSIVNEYSNKDIIGLHNSQRLGKTSALNRAIIKAKNEILIFSDANSMFRPDAIKKLVRHFFDDSIGGVSGRKVVLQNKQRNASIGDNLYWNYESTLKQAESDFDSIPTADGEIFALRKSLYQPIDPKIINDDMAITFNILSQGKRVIYDKTAVTEEEASITLKDDFNVKSRMVYGGLQLIKQYKKELNPFTSFYGLQFFFHKTLRYLMWLLLGIIFISNASLIQQNIFYQIFFKLQILFYAFAIIGFIMDRLKIKKFILFYLPYYYCNVNLASFKGFLFFLKKHSNVEVWKKAIR